MTSSIQTPTASLERQLLLLRHAKSSWAQPTVSDFERGLNERGRGAAPLMGRKLRQDQIAVDLILASTAQRVRETLDLLMAEWQLNCPIVWEKRLYLASAETIIASLSDLDSWQNPSEFSLRAITRVMVVGHNPGLSELACHLTGGSYDMPTAGLVFLEQAASSWWQGLRSRPWRESKYWKPRELEL